MSQKIQEYFENLTELLPNLTGKEKQILADHINFITTHVHAQTKYNPNFELKQVNTLPIRTIASPFLTSVNFPKTIDISIFKSSFSE